MGIYLVSQDGDFVPAGHVKDVDNVLAGKNVSTWVRRTVDHYTSCLIIQERFQVLQVDLPRPVRLKQWLKSHGNHTYFIFKIVLIMWSCYIKYNIQMIGLYNVWSVLTKWAQLWVHGVPNKNIAIFHCSSRPCIISPIIQIISYFVTNNGDLWFWHSYQV